MSNVLKSSTMFLAGLGASLAVGWWLKNRDTQSSGGAEPQPVDLPLAGADYVLESEALPNIPLPPSAFIDVDAPPSANIVINSEVVTTADDLTSITGIGAKTAETLAELGITTFADLAYADAHAIKAKVARASLETIQGWINAAKELVNLG